VGYQYPHRDDTAGPRDDTSDRIMPSRWSRGLIQDQSARSPEAFAFLDEAINWCPTPVSKRKRMVPFEQRIYDVRKGSCWYRVLQSTSSKLPAGTEVRDWKPASAGSVLRRPAPSAK
jgi:hypothetical protein